MTTMNEAALKSSNGPSPTNGVLPEPSFDDGHSSGRFFLLDDFKDFYDLLPITIKQTGSLGMVIRQRELTLPTGRVIHRATMVTAVNLRSMADNHGILEGDIVCVSNGDGTLNFVDFAEYPALFKTDNRPLALILMRQKRTFDQVTYGGIGRQACSFLHHQGFSDLEAFFGTPNAELADKYLLWRNAMGYSEASIDYMRGVPTKWKRKLKKRLADERKALEDAVYSLNVTSTPCNASVSGNKHQIILDKENAVESLDPQSKRPQHAFGAVSPAPVSRTTSSLTAFKPRNH